MATTIIIGILLALGALNGLRRGAIKEGTALIGVLLGALLAQGWAGQWARQLTGSSSDGPRTAERVITLGLLIGVALFSGYGSGFLLPRRQPERRSMTIGHRIGGGVLGFVNLGLLCGFGLLFIDRLWYGGTPASPPATGTALAARSWIQRAPLSRFLLDRLGLMLLGLATLFALSALVVGITRTLRRPARSTGQTKPAAAPGSTARPADATAAHTPITSSSPHATTTTVPAANTRISSELEAIKRVANDESPKPAPGAVPNLLDPQRKSQS